MSMNQDETPARPDYPPPPQNDPPGAPEYPPQQGYSTYPQQGNTYAGPPPARPGFDFQDLLSRWRAVLYPPSVASFDMQKPAANWNTILISLALVGLVQGVFSFITGFEYHKSGTPYPGLGTIIGGFIGAYVGFFITAGLIYLLARLLGGTGEFLEHVWLLSLVWIPIQVATSVIGVIPVLGGIVQFVLAIYAIILYIYATSSAQRMTLGRSTVAVLIPGIALAAIVLILLIIATAFFVGLGLSIPFR